MKQDGMAWRVRGRCSHARSCTHAPARTASSVGRGVAGAARGDAMEELGR